MLKKTILIAVLMVSVCFSGYAIEKGTMSLGGSVSFTSIKSDSESPSYNYFSLYPSASYFVVDNLCIDAGLGVGVGWQKDYDNRYSYHFEIGSRYFYKLFYAGFLYDFNRSGNEGDMETRQYMLFRIGRLFNLAKNLYFNFSLNYNIGIGKIDLGSYKIDNDQRDFSARIGISYFFKLKH